MIKIFLQDVSVQSMEKICLDSDAVVDFLKGKTKTVEEVRIYTTKGELCIASTTLFELLMMSKKKIEIKKLCDDLMVLDIDRESVELASRILSEQMLKEKPMMYKDALLAGVCIKNNTYLYTKNRRRFEGIKELKLI